MPGIKYWNTVPREVVQWPSLELFQARPDRVLKPLSLIAPALSRVWTG